MRLPPPSLDLAILCGCTGDPLRRKSLERSSQTYLRVEGMAGHASCLSSRMHLGASGMSASEAVHLLSSAAEPTRLAILATLEAAPDHELCVCELVDTLRERQYNVSRHLKVLAECGLVTRRSVGRWSYYRLAFERRETRGLLALLDSLGAAMDPRSRERLRRRLSQRENGVCVLGVRDPSLLSRRPAGDR